MTGFKRSFLYTLTSSLNQTKTAPSARAKPMDALPALGNEHTLATATETDSGIDLLCYCPRCLYKRETLERVQTNFYRGFAFFGLWLGNVYLYILARRFADQYEFSESIAWDSEHRGEVLLQQDLRDDTTVVGRVIREHERQQAEFDQLCGWSFCALLVLAVVVWLLVMLMSSW